MADMTLEVAGNLLGEHTAQEVAEAIMNDPEFRLPGVIDLDSLQTTENPEAPTFLVIRADLVTAAVTQDDIQNHILGSGVRWLSDTDDLFLPIGAIALIV